MSKTYRIIVATHKRFQMPEDKDLYIPIQVGSEGKEDLGYQPDNQGVHISYLNPYYCELTGLYWAWKNLECDWYITVDISHQNDTHIEKQLVWMTLFFPNQK